MANSQNRYNQLIEKVFFDGYKTGTTTIPFNRDDFNVAADELNMPVPKNPGDIIYSMRYRNKLPDLILDTQPDGMEWIIEGAGRAKYCFNLVRINRIIPNRDLIAIKIPDATPEIVSHYALSDEQALLAKIRYNRLTDIFLGITTYSLQNHLRTTVASIGQIEIDEIYVGLNQDGCQYIVPLQAKGGTDQLSSIQTKQDIAYCQNKYPNLICRPISTQFMEDNLIAIFELTIQNEKVRLVQERHYHLLPSNKISAEDLRQYHSLSGTR